MFSKPEIWWSVTEQMRRHQENFERNCKKWEEMPIGTKVKIPWFTMTYSKEMQFKCGTVVDKVAPTTLKVNVEGAVKDCDIAFIQDI